MRVVYKGRREGGGANTAQMSLSPDERRQCVESVCKHAHPDGEFHGKTVGLADAREYMETQGSLKSEQCLGDKELWKTKQPCVDDERRCSDVNAMLSKIRKEGFDGEKNRLIRTILQSDSFEWFDFEGLVRDVEECGIEANEGEKLELCIGILELGINREIKRWNEELDGKEELDPNDWRLLEGKAVDVINRERLGVLRWDVLEHDLVELVSLENAHAVSEALEYVNELRDHDEWELDGLVHMSLLRTANWMESGDAFRRLHRMAEALLSASDLKVPDHLMGALYMKLLHMGFAANNEPNEHHPYRPFRYLDAKSMEAALKRVLETARRYQDDRRTRRNALVLMGTNDCEQDTDLRKRTNELLLSGEYSKIMKSVKQMVDEVVGKSPMFDPNVLKRTPGNGRELENCKHAAFYRTMELVLFGEASGVPIVMPAHAIRSLWPQFEHMTMQEVQGLITAFNEAKEVAKRSDGGGEKRVVALLDNSEECRAFRATHGAVLAGLMVDGLLAIYENPTAPELFDPDFAGFPSVYLLTGGGYSRVEGAEADNPGRLDALARGLESSRPPEAIAVLAGWCGICRSFKERNEKVLKGLVDDGILRILEDDKATIRALGIEIQGFPSFFLVNDDGTLEKVELRAKNDGMDMDAFLRKRRASREALR